MATAQRREYERRRNSTPMRRKQHARWERERYQRNALYRKRQLKARLQRMRQPAEQARNGLRNARRRERDRTGAATLTVGEQRGLLRAWAYRCAYCDKRVYRDALPNKPRKLNWDHVDPSRGFTLSNVVPACRLCNIRKGARTPEQWLGPDEAAAFRARHKATLKAARIAQVQALQV